MMRFLSKSRRFLLVLLSACAVLQACAAAEHTGPEMKIGMHYDAVLDFVVEYPLSWHKDRRLAYGSRDGEVRWVHPEHPATLLRVKSSMQKPPVPDVQAQLDQVLQEYPGLEVLSKEEVTLPAGTAWHLSGQLAQGQLDLYLIVHADRRFLITLSTAPEDLDNYREIMERVTNSFQIMP